MMISVDCVQLTIRVKCKHRNKFGYRGIDQFKI